MGAQCHTVCIDYKLSTLVGGSQRLVAIIDLCSSNCTVPCILRRQTLAQQHQGNLCTPIYFLLLRCQPGIRHTRQIRIIIKFDLVTVIHQCIGRVFAYCSVDFTDPASVCSGGPDSRIIQQCQFALGALEGYSCLLAGIQQCMKSSITAIVVLHIPICL